MHSVWLDVRHGLRLLARSPGFAIAGIGILGLGVGATTAIFGLVHSVLLRPLPYPDSQRIVTISELDSAGRRLGVALPDFLDWSIHANSFDAIAAVRGDSTTVVTPRQNRRVYALRFHGDILRVYGAAIGHGRPFTSDELRDGTAVAVVPWGFADSVWGSAERAIGESVELSGVTFSVVGVLARAADERVDLFVPAAAFGREPSSRSDYQWNVVARLRAGMTLGAARGEMQAIADKVRAEHGVGTPAVGVAVSSLLDDTVRGVRPALVALMAAGGLLLLIVCTNIANLLLARAVERRREIAVRQQLGASRGRVVRQLLLESMPLALLGTGVGLVLAHWSFAGLLAAAPFGIPRRAEIAIDAPVFAFGVLAALVGGLLVGIVPALRVPSGQLATQLAGGGRTSSGNDGRLRELLVTAQFAVALALLSCAGLLMKSVLRLMQVDAGYEYSRALIGETELPPTPYASDERLNAFWRLAVERVGALPGVEAVGVAASAPLEGVYPNGTIQFLDEPDRQGQVWYGIATAGFFPALEIPLLQGRLFNDRDSRGAPHAAVINQVAADRFWPGQNPIGRRVRWLGGGAKRTDDPPLTIVGVAGNFRHQSLTVEPVPEIYVHFFQHPSQARDADIVIRTAAPPAMTAAVREVFQSIDGDLPMRFHTLESMHRQSFAQPRFQAMLIGFFGVSALLLSVIGLYSSMAYAVGRQTREIGIRLALGGTPRTVERRVLGSAMSLAAGGAALGVVLGLAGGRLIANLLFGVSAGDPVVFLAATGLLFATALAAAYVPARRASRTNVIDALRYEH